MAPGTSSFQVDTPPALSGESGSRSLSAGRALPRGSAGARGRAESHAPFRLHFGEDDAQHAGRKDQHGTHHKSVVVICVCITVPGRLGNAVVPIRVYCPGIVLYGAMGLMGRAGHLHLAQRRVDDDRPVRVRQRQRRGEQIRARGGGDAGGERPSGGRREYTIV